jgi:NAD dependent epimerase/dehydratase
MTPMEWGNKRVLVTGAGGFIGSHLTERLVNLGARVRALVRYNSRNDWGLLEGLPGAVKRRLEVIASDLTDPFATLSFPDDCDVIFHLAALIAIPYSYTAPAQYLAANGVGTLNLLEAARRSGVQKFVHTSTSEVYGTAQYLPIDEAHPLTGQSPYAASKIAADKMAESYHLAFGLPVVTLRPFNTFGPRQSARAVIPTIITQALTGDTIHLGHLEPRRDLTYIDDTVEGFLRGATAPQAVGEVINLGTGMSVSIGELAQKIITLAGGKKEIACEAQRERPQNSEVWHLESNNQRAREILGWRPKVSLEEGLRKTMDFIRDNLQTYKADIYNV